jgi:hypothetical protein
MSKWLAGVVSSVPANTARNVPDWQAEKKAVLLLPAAPGCPDLSGHHDFGVNRRVFAAS